MSWIFAALLGYSLQGVSSVVDKFLLGKGRIGSPALYAFGNALTSLPFLALLPFEFVLFAPEGILLGVLSGFLFLFALLAMYRAVKRSEVSRAAPLVGAATLGFLFLLSLLFSASSGAGVSAYDALALGLLAAGGILLSTGGRGIRGPGFTRCVFVSGALFAASLIILKESYIASNFISGFVWSKFGMFLGGLMLFTVPSFRSDIASGSRRLTQPERKSFGTGGFFLLNQVFGGLGSFLISFAVSLGPATLVQGMNGVQYGVVFVLATLFSLRAPGIYREHISAPGLLRKIAALVLLSLGIYLAATGSGFRGLL
jgi:uncharacterized membrane protein